MTTYTSSINQFRFQLEKVKTGTVYHYIKSNMDGSYPARIYFRLMDGEHVDVWKFEAHNADAAHVIAHMDWKTFSADGIESSVVTSDGHSRPQARLTSSLEDASFSVHWQGGQDTIHVGHFPIHMYNFDLISLNVALRHWVKPDGEVTIGILQPNFDPEPDAMLKYEGKVTLRYIQDEEREGQACRRYEIQGDGLQGQCGTVWVDRLMEHMVDVEIPVADNPDWDDFKFLLVRVQHMDAVAWDQFITQETAKLKPVNP